MYDEQRLIELRGVSKSFGDTQVLHNIDLYIRKREFVTLLGPSGCGKTTHAAHHRRLRRCPTAADVIFDGRGHHRAFRPTSAAVNTVFQKLRAVHRI